MIKKHEQNTDFDHCFFEKPGQIWLFILRDLKSHENIGMNPYESFFPHISSFWITEENWKGPTLSEQTHVSRPKKLPKILAAQKSKRLEQHIYSTSK